MSYADVAASGPKQSPEELRYQSCTIRAPISFKTEHLLICRRENSRAPPVPSLSHSESEEASLVDVDSPHVVSVSSNFESQEIKTDTQAERIEREAEDKARAEAQKAEKAAKDAKEKAEEKARKAKASAKKEGKKLQENSDNPVYIANALIWTIGAVALGIGAYQKHSEGKLDAKLAGTVAAGVGAFAVADYVASSWLLENKYPPK